MYTHGLNESTFRCLFSVSWVVIPPKLWIKGPRITKRIVLESIAESTGCSVPVFSIFLLRPIMPASHLQVTQIWEGWLVWWISNSEFHPLDMLLKPTNLNLTAINVKSWRRVANSTQHKIALAWSQCLWENNASNNNKKKHKKLLTCQLRMNQPHNGAVPRLMPSGPHWYTIQNKEESSLCFHYGLGHMGVIALNRC